MQLLDFLEGYTAAKARLQDRLQVLRRLRALLRR